MTNNQPEPKIAFKQHQASFTAYIRNPEKNPVPEGIKPERVAMYADLLFNNIENFLSGNFPVLKKIHTTEQWLQLVRDFFSEHQSQTPYFAEIPQEFISYLQDERNNPDDVPFLLELAHYEWVELALALAPEQFAQLSDAEITHLAAESVMLSPLAWPLVYQYPVHCIAPEYLPLKAPDELTCMIVYRDQQDDVQFLKITPLTYQLVEALQNNTGLTCLEVLMQLLQESQSYDSEVFIKAGLDTLQNLAKKGIVIKRISPE